MLLATHMSVVRVVDFDYDVALRPSDKVREGTWDVEISLECAIASQASRSYDRMAIRGR